MNIKAKLSFQFTLIVLIILLFFTGFTYYISYTTYRTKFRKDLLDKAKNTAILFINVAEVDSMLLKKIHQSTISLEAEEIALTDSAQNIIYSNKLQSLSEKIVRMDMYQDNINYFSISEKDGVCYKHRTDKQTYHAYVMAYDRSRRAKLAELRNILFWSIFSSLGFSILISYFFSKNAMHPITNIIQSIQSIDPSQLSVRLDEGNKKDEIAQLAKNFNRLLTDLEIVFRNQEDFVSNASHELRTPLSVMILEANYLLSQPRKPEEYSAHLTKLVNDLKKLNILLSSLLELAQINRNNSIQLSPVRIDEIVYDALDEIKSKYESRKILLKIMYPENDENLIIEGNSGMLSMAFKNLIDNACKFSEDEVVIEFMIKPDLIKVSISDLGIGIPEAELESIFKPFSRGSNVKFIGGFGIGLTLVNKIFELNRAQLNVISKINEGTKFEISFQRLS